MHKILILLFFIVLACRFNKKSENDQKDIEAIENLGTSNKVSLGISFQRGFENTNVTIYLGGVKFFNEVISTDDQDGLASYTEIPIDFKTISISTDKDSISINNEDYKLINVDNWDSKLTYKSYKEIPKNLIYD